MRMQQHRRLRFSLRCLGRERGTRMITTPTVWLIIGKIATETAWWIRARPIGRTPTISGSGSTSPNQRTTRSSHKPSSFDLQKPNGYEIHTESHAVDRSLQHGGGSEPTENQRGDGIQQCEGRRRRGAFRVGGFFHRRFVLASVRTLHQSLVFRPTAYLRNLLQQSHGIFRRL